MRVLSDAELAEWRAGRAARNPEKVIVGSMRETEPEHTEIPERRPSKPAKDLDPLPERRAVEASVARMMLYYQEDRATFEAKVRSTMRTRRNLIGNRSFRWVCDNLEDVVRAIVIHDMNVIYNRYGWTNRRWSSGDLSNTH